MLDPGSPALAWVISQSTWRLDVNRLEGPHNSIWRRVAKCSRPGRSAPPNPALQRTRPAAVPFGHIDATLGGPVS